MRKLVEWKNSRRVFRAHRNIDENTLFALYIRIYGFGLPADIGNKLCQLIIRLRRC